MGVSGSGKTTVGRLLADMLHWQFIDGDELHPVANLEKMKKGIPLTDEDRMPWLASIRNRLLDLCQRGDSAVIACSALKESYRRYLLSGTNNLRAVYLKGTFDLIEKRLKERKNHFFDAALLSSQFETLEEPQGVFTIDISLRPDRIAHIIRTKLDL